MATSQSYIEYVCEQINGSGIVRYKKMFGEYMIYVNDKPVLMVCDDIVYVKRLDSIKEMMKNAKTGYPYSGSKEHYILDIDDTDFSKRVVTLVEKVTPISKSKIAHKSMKKEDTSLDFNILIANLDKLHTTALGVQRIRQNIGPDVLDVVDWCKKKIKKPSSSIRRTGKNWYVDIDNYEITINVHSCTIITVHKLKKNF